MEHSQAVLILDLLMKDSKVFQGLVFSRKAYPPVLERYNMARLLNDLSQIATENVDTGTILEMLFKDSKVFQGIAVTNNCYPFENRGGELRRMFGTLLRALLDVPQNDMLEDEDLNDAPFVEICPACHHKPEYLLFFNEACTNCGAILRESQHSNFRR